jgi:hypothetical protein
MNHQDLIARIEHEWSLYKTEGEENGHTLDEGDERFWKNELYCEEMKSIQEDEYTRLLAEVQERTGVVTLVDQLRASLTVGDTFRNIDSIISALFALAAAKRLILTADSEGIFLTNERGNMCSVMEMHFVGYRDCSLSDLTAFAQHFWDDFYDFMD